MLAALAAGCLRGTMGFFTRTLAAIRIDASGTILVRCAMAALCFALDPGHSSTTANLWSCLLAALGAVPILGRRDTAAAWPSAGALLVLAGVAPLNVRSGKTVASEV